jgi:integrase/recombinase XerD
MPNPFGKYPASSTVKKYLEATRHCYAQSTQEERSRKLRFVIRLLHELNAPSQPKLITEKHVLVFLDQLNKKHLKGKTRGRLMRALGEYLAYYDNEILLKMKAKKQVKFPTDPEEEIRHIPEDAIERIHNATLTMEGWDGAVARFITMAYPYTGLRPSELRKVNVVDLDLATWTMIVKHPKGEGSYGRQRKVGIPEGPVREAFANYLEERRDYLENLDINNNAEPLIPLFRKGQLGYWPHQYFIWLKSQIERQCGIRFKIKDYRSTYCQLAIDKGAPLEAVSRVMGHKTTKTTESYYGRMRDEPAIAEVNRALSKPSVPTIK